MVVQGKADRGLSLVPKRERDGWLAPEIPNNIDNIALREKDRIVGNAAAQNEWFEANRDRLYADPQFRNRVIAVLGCEIIDSDDDMMRLHERLSPNAIVLMRRVVSRNIRIISDQDIAAEKAA
ncbi:hypothetical protein ACFL3C_03965 [Patescibacteria group bacterium]